MISVKVYFIIQQKTGREKDKRETMNYASSSFKRLRSSRNACEPSVAISLSAFLSLKLFPGPDFCLFGYFTSWPCRFGSD